VRGALRDRGPASGPAEVDLTLISGPFGTRKSVEMPYLLAEIAQHTRTSNPRKGPLS